MAHIFISYAREDVDQARGLAELLDSEGFEVWWDPHIRVGEEFPEKIEKAIWDCQHVIVLWTKHSVKSEWVLREAEQAKKQNKILPVRMGNIELPRGFQTVHTVEFAGWPALLTELYRGIGGGAFTMPSSAVHSIMDMLQGSAVNQKAPTGPPATDEQLRRMRSVLKTMEAANRRRAAQKYRKFWLIVVYGAAGLVGAVVLWLLLRQLFL